MKDKKTLILSIIVLIIVSIITFLILTHKEKYFNKINLPLPVAIVNSTDRSYIDTIVSIGIIELEIIPKAIVIRELKNGAPKIQDGLKTEAYIVSKDNQYLIYIDKFGRSRTMEILAHELIHVEQYYRGDLSIDLIENTLTWKGHTYPYKELPPYHTREWEIEASERGKTLNKRLHYILYEKQ